MGGPVYTGSEYPPGYNGSVFFGDYGERFLKRLVSGEGGALAPEPFASEWDGVDIETTSNGNLLYVTAGDWGAGSGAVKEIVYSPGNARPTAVLRADPTAGESPLSVQFDASGSAIPMGML